MATNELVTTAILNQLAIPTITATGTVGASELEDGSVSAVKLGPTAYGFQWGTDSSVAASAFKILLTTHITSIASGATIRFQALTANTGATTMTVSNSGTTFLTARKLVKFSYYSGSAKVVELAAGDIRVNQVVEAVYCDGLDGGTGAWVLTSGLSLPQVMYSSLSGGPTAYTGTCDPPLLAYSQAAGRLFLVLMPATAAGASATIALDGLAALPVKAGGVAVQAEMLLARQYYVLTCNGTEIGMVGRKTEYVGEATLPTDDTYVSFTHGLGKAPRQVRAVLKCLTAEDGWAIGDEIDVTSLRLNAATTDTPMFAVMANATEVVVRRFSTGLITYAPKGAGGLQLITNANWGLKVYAGV